MTPLGDDLVACSLPQEIHKGIAINHIICDRCGVCVGVCPGLALTLCRNVLEFHPERCTGCLDCVTSCPVGALQEER